MNNSIFLNVENVNIDGFNFFEKNDYPYDIDKSLDKLLDSNFITTNNNNYIYLCDNNNINTNNTNNDINTIKPNTILSINKPPISFIYVVYTTDVKEGDILEQFHDDIYIKQNDVFDFIKKKNVINCNKTTTDLYQATEDLFCDDFNIDFKTRLNISICESKSFKS
mgnify:CR=1 FL=1|jgi:hypothetical protein